MPLKKSNDMSVWRVISRQISVLFVGVGRGQKGRSARCPSSFKSGSILLSG